eukprot:m51a1_g8706 hypothetical protein (257) ;mRNA; f:111923-113289
MMSSELVARAAALAYRVAPRVPFVNRALVLIRLAFASRAGLFRVPRSNLALALAAVAYLLSPCDVIPDVIPVIGFLDDGAVMWAVAWVLSAVVKRFVDWELDGYRAPPEATAAPVATGMRMDPRRAMLAMFSGSLGLGVAMLLVSYLWGVSLAKAFVGALALFCAFLLLSQHSPARGLLPQKLLPPLSRAAGTGGEEEPEEGEGSAPELSAAMARYVNVAALKPFSAEPDHLDRIRRQRAALQREVDKIAVCAAHK